jgi:hypothetical protein
LFNGTVKESEDRWGEWSQNHVNWTYPSGHVVAIVGWDDTFDDNGAWLCKINYGPGYRNNGFYWIPYSSTGIDHMVSLRFEPADNYDNNNQYSGGTGLIIQGIHENKHGKKTEVIKTAVVNNSIKNFTKTEEDWTVAVAKAGPINLEESNVFRKLDFDLTERIKGHDKYKTLTGKPVMAAIYVRYTGKLVFSDKTQEELTDKLKYNIVFNDGGDERIVLKTGVISILSSNDAKVNLGILNIIEHFGVDTIATNSSQWKITIEITLNDKPINFPVKGNIVYSIAINLWNNNFKTRQTIVANDGLISSYNKYNYFLVDNSSNEQKVYMKGLSSVDDRTLSGKLYRSQSIPSQIEVLTNQLISVTKDIKSIASILNALHGDKEIDGKSVENYCNNIKTTSDNVIGELDLISSGLRTSNNVIRSLVEIS